MLAANGPDLATVALRPHLIWGPGDPHLDPARRSRRRRAGKLRRIGTRPVKVDVTYIDNAADAHLLAADRLDVGSPVAGKAYFISNGEPVDLWEFINRVLAEAGLPPVTRTVSAWKARLAGRVLEWVYRLLRLPGEPPMTRFVASQMSHVALVRHLGRAPRPRLRAEGRARGGAEAAGRVAEGVSVGPRAFRRDLHAVASSAHR